MGRVYNALVRADRLKDGERIGAPSKSASLLSFNAASTARRIHPEVSDTTVPATEQLESVGDALSAYAASFSSPQTPVFEEPGEIANIGELAIDPHLAALCRDDVRGAERYHALAARVLNLLGKRKRKTILITSAEPGEGKTTIATCLAWSLAKLRERRVALVDAGLTSGSTARYLGIEAKRGWNNLADGSCELRETMIRIDPNGLYVVRLGESASGGDSDNLLSRLDEVIAKLTARFDIVVIDSPPILESPETKRLVAVLDGTVIVARAGHTDRRKVAAARKLVPKDRRLGLVLNEADK
jgi:protein-tyrosine kinase